MGKDRKQTKTKTNGKNGNSRGKRKIPITTTPPKPQTVEDLNDEQRMALFFQYKRKLSGLIATQKAAADAVKQAFALAKEEGVSKKDILLAIDLDTDGGDERAQADVERLMRVARWCGASLGSQFDLFETTAADRHFAAGKRAAMQDEPAKPPKELAQADAQAWINGHHAGTAALSAQRAAQFAPLGTQPATYTTQ